MKPSRTVERSARFLLPAVLLALVAAPGARAEDQAEHPLDPAIAWAKESLKQMESVKDYSATLVKRERINGKLGEHNYAFVKVRNEPLSVYMYYVGPEGVKGREVIYVAGKNDGKLIAHEGTGALKVFGSVWLDPTGTIAMRGERYPITEIGIKRLVEQLVERAEQDKKIPLPVEVTIKRNAAKINDRPVSVIMVSHPKRHPNHEFYKARIFVDDELNLPVRYEAYDWPAKEGGKPVLMEEYTYLNLEVNKGYTDADFDPENANYKF